ncbi:MAG: hypothetical protein QNJ55_30460 [Xenococcus sp. MO_188.B8]|nr:hypothetical protein [Xenococcus sp. MO_188.B8]
MMRLSYDTDLTDEQWLKISSFYPEANHRVRPRTQDFREIINAILYPSLALQNVASTE